MECSNNPSSWTWRDVLILVFIVIFTILLVKVAQLNQLTKDHQNYLRTCVTQDELGQRMMAEMDAVSSS